MQIPLPKQRGYQSISSWIMNEKRKKKKEFKDSNMIPYILISCFVHFGRKVGVPTEKSYHHHWSGESPNTNKNTDCSARSRMSHSSRLMLHTYSIPLRQLMVFMSGFNLYSFARCYFLPQCPFTAKRAGAASIN